MDDIQTEADVKEGEATEEKRVVRFCGLLSHTGSQTEVFQSDGWVQERGAKVPQGGVFEKV